MRRLFLQAALLLPAAALGDTVEITLTNPASFPRSGEMVEVDETDVRFCLDGPAFVLYAPDGKEVPWQATHDGKIIFQADIPAGGTAVYTARNGRPAPVEPKVYGRLFRERGDDMTWENEHAAYRAYGPGMQKWGERGFGYDVWTKSVSHPVIEKRYYLDKRKKVSFHKDHGEGMDPYTVGPTLGGGTAALLDGEEILYPWCWSDYEILDRGPLRFCVRLHYPAMTAEKGIPADETRVITLDAGDWLNRTEVIWRGLDTPRECVAGQVVHRQNPDGWVADPEKGIAAYADLTENAEVGNGTIFVGTVAETGGLTPVYMPLETPAGDAVGHIVQRGSSEDGKPLVYWWGSGWSKGGMETMDKWLDTLRHKRECLENPIAVSVRHLP